MFVIIREMQVAIFPIPMNMKCVGKVVHTEMTGVLKLFPQRILLIGFNSVKSHRLSIFLLSLLYYQQFHSCTTNYRI